ncbi:hypothetical protein B0G84_4975 [Paraburkholderia sp. BL8N3]|nr:hypothetical protein [Paraburkholderia sp. BL8N3]TCK39635.1 hypothetical protein B0G84_4975 [Paraburkholderia sp. BL8N3]
MNIGLSVPVRNGRLTFIVTAAGASAILTLYNGTQPATGGTATTALSAHTCSSVLGTVASGVLTFNAIGNATASATGTATWARLTTSGGTFVADFDVSTTAAGTGVLQMATTSVVANATVQINSGVFNEGNA